MTTDKDKIAALEGALARAEKCDKYTPANEADEAIVYQAARAHLEQLKAGKNG